MIPHGTAGGYTNHRCRCEACTKAWRDWHAGEYRNTPQADCSHARWVKAGTNGQRKIRQCVQCGRREVIGEPWKRGRKTKSP